MTAQIPLRVVLWSTIAPSVPQAQEHVPDTENIRTRRGVLNTLGDGFVEAIDDDTLMAIAENQPAQ